MLVRLVMGLNLDYSLRLSPSGARVIDTPGLRALRLNGDAEALDAAFDCVASLAAQCRF